jgi:hypothetical protein
MKTYEAPHKGLRNALSQLELLSGRMDFRKALEVQKLYMLGRDVFEILDIHADDENEVTLAELEKRCPGCSNHDKLDHEHLESEQRSLEAFLVEMYEGSQNGATSTGLGKEFYLLLSRYHGSYLLHLAEEETVTQPLLWKHFTDEELAEHRVRIMQRNPPETLLIWLRFIIPAQSHMERVPFLTGFKKVASTSLFDSALDIIKRELPAQDFSSLYEAIQSGVVP